MGKWFYLLWEVKIPKCQSAHGNNSWPVKSVKLSEVFKADKLKRSFSGTKVMRVAEFKSKKMKSHMKIR